MRSLRCDASGRRPVPCAGRRFYCLMRSSHRPPGPGRPPRGRQGARGRRCAGSSFPVTLALLVLGGTPGAGRGRSGQTRKRSGPRGGERHPPRAPPASFEKRHHSAELFQKALCRGPVPKVPPRSLADAPQWSPSGMRDQGAYYCCREGQTYPFGETSGPCPPGAGPGSAGGSQPCDVFSRRTDSRCEGPRRQRHVGPGSWRPVFMPQCHLFRSGSCRGRPRPGQMLRPRFEACLSERGVVQPQARETKEEAEDA